MIRSSFAYIEKDAEASEERYNIFPDILWNPPHEPTNLNGHQLEYNLHFFLFHILPFNFHINNV